MNIFPLTSALFVSIKITFGHAKDGRKDLKRFVLGLVADQFSIPIFTQSYDGNKSDKIQARFLTCLKKRIIVFLWLPSLIFVSLTSFGWMYSLRNQRVKVTITAASTVAISLLAGSEL